MYTLNLQWKSFNVDLKSMEELARSLDSNCVGCSANSCFEIHFSDTPSDTLISEIQAHWDSVTPSSPEALAYKTKDERQAEAQADIAAKKASAKTKLKALGLSDDECAAILGV